jgi:NAD(P)-dependent dehydrogenase (short-subunit alcohol dehydrogenase family)
MWREDRKYAVVTDASRGIGRAITLRFAEGGYDVWAIARSQDDLDDLARSAPGQVHPLAMDVSKPEQVIDGARLIARAGAPHVLVNNAGVTKSARLFDLALEEFEHVMAVNLTAAFLLCRELLPKMAKAKRGRVINIVSTGGAEGFHSGAAYCASKHALLGLTRALAVEFAGKGVTVNAICPGWADTDVPRSLSRSIAKRTERAPDAVADEFRRLNPTRELTATPDVAKLAWFLASSNAEAVTGAVYTLDAGEAA